MWVKFHNIQEWKGDALISKTVTEYAVTLEILTQACWGGGRDRIGPVTDDTRDDNTPSCDRMTALQFYKLHLDPKWLAISLGWNNFVLCAGIVSQPLTLCQPASDASHPAAKNMLTTLTVVTHLLLPTAGSVTVLRTVSAGLKCSATLYKTIHSFSSLEPRAAKILMLYLLS